MAIGDTLFIADKETLGVPNPTIADTATVMNYLKKIFDTFIIPTKPMNADYRISAPTTNTWYTALDVVNGKGTLNRISVVNTSVQNYLTEIRVTVDGVSYDIKNTTGTNTNTRAIAPKSQSTASTDSLNALDYIANIYFKSSVKVEVRATFATAGSIMCSVDYALV